VLQLEARINSLDYTFGFKLFKLYEKRIIQAPKSVRDIFTTEKIASAFANFRGINNKILNYAKRTESLKLPFYKNLTDPCFLLVIFSNIQNTKADRVYDSFCDNITLVDLISLSSTLLHKKYFPKPIKRIFIPITCKKVRPLGIASSLDRIVQQALTIVVRPRLELVFSDFSYGFKPHCNHHSALKYIYNHWRSVHWFLECNLVQCFGVCNYSILLSTFTRYVDDY
jgi:RNA-directed DNA polymerase